MLTACFCICKLKERYAGIALKHNLQKVIKLLNEIYAKNIKTKMN